MHRGVDLPRKDFGSVREIRGMSDLLRNLSFSLNDRASRLARSEVVSLLKERDGDYLPAVSSEEDEGMASGEEDGSDELDDEEIED